MFNFPILNEDIPVEVSMRCDVFIDIYCLLQKKVNQSFGKENQVLN